MDFYFLFKDFNLFIIMNMFTDKIRMIYFTITYFKAHLNEINQIINYNLCSDFELKYKNKNIQKKEKTT